MTIVSSTILRMAFGTFRVCYHKNNLDEVISFSYGNITKGKPIVRLHSACFFGEVFCSKHCDCQQQLHKTLALIKKNKSGVVVYGFQEGRGIGLEKKIKAMELQRVTNIDTFEAFKKMGLPPDLRNYSTMVNALDDLFLSKNIFLVSDNPDKINALKEKGYIILKQIKLRLTLTKLMKQEIMAKKSKFSEL